MGLRAGRVLPGDRHETARGCPCAHRFRRDRCVADVCCLSGLSRRCRFAKGRGRWPLTRGGIA